MSCSITHKLLFNSWYGNNQQHYLLCCFQQIGLCYSLLSRSVVNHKVQKYIADACALFRHWSIKMNENCNSLLRLIKQNVPCTLTKILVNVCFILILNWIKSLGFPLVQYGGMRKYCRKHKWRWLKRLLWLETWKIWFIKIYAAKLHLKLFMYY